jgi:hypothetical protein
MLPGEVTEKYTFLKLAEGAVSILSFGEGDARLDHVRIVHPAMLPFHQQSSDCPCFLTHRLRFL